MQDAKRRIDHVVVAVHDLDAAGAFYERLGFQVGARNRHPWGTENRLIQFSSSFIELIALGDAAPIADHAPRHFSFGAFLRDYLARREGLAMLVLDSDNAKADAAIFARAGIGEFEPFFFERKGRRPDGAEIRVAFTLAFAVDDRAPDCGFFVCQQHAPENFWNPAFQRHDNHARDITAITMTAPDPSAHATFFSAFAGSAASQDDAAGLSIPLRGGRIDIRPGRGSETSPAFRAMTVAMPDPAAQATRLRDAAIPFEIEGATLRIPADSACGLEIRLEPDPI